MPDPTPAVLELSNAFRLQLLARERRAASAMVRYYGRIWQGLQDDITALQASVNPAWTQGQIMRHERVVIIQRQAGEELSRYARFADDAIRAGKRESVVAGDRQARALLQAAFPRGAGIDITFAAMPREAVEALVGFLQDGSPLREVIEGYVGSAAGQFSDTMAVGLASGWNPRRLARELRGRFGMGLTDSLRLSRTEQLRAYRTASLHAYQQSDVVVGWERKATLDDRTCMACIELDGKRYGLDEYMDDHIAGRCAMLPITLSYADLGIDAPEPDFQREMGRDWFRRQDEATQRRMMGDGMWEAWQEGKFELDRIPKLVRNKTWGDSWVTRGLGELTGE